MAAHILSIIASFFHLLDLERCTSTAGVYDNPAWNLLKKSQEQIGCGLAQLHNANCHLAWTCIGALFLVLVVHIVYTETEDWITEKLLKSYIPLIVFIIGLILLLTTSVHASVPEGSQSQGQYQGQTQTNVGDSSRGEDKLLAAPEKDGDWTAVQRFMDSMNSQEKSGAVGMIVLIVFIVALFALVTTIVMNLKSERKKDSKEVQKDYNSIEP